jgi:hypothetical protein
VPAQAWLRRKIRARDFYFANSGRTRSVSSL